MDAVQVEPVVPTIGLTAGRDADITARIGISASCIPLIWVCILQLQGVSHDATYTLGLQVSLYGGTPFLSLIAGV